MSSTSQHLSRTASSCLTPSRHCTMICPRHRLPAPRHSPVLSPPHPTAARRARLLRGSSTRSINQPTNQLTPSPKAKPSDGVGGSLRREVAGGWRENRVGRASGRMFTSRDGSIRLWEWGARSLRWRRSGSGGRARRDRGPRGGQCKSRRGSELRGWARALGSASSPLFVVGVRGRGAPVPRVFSSLPELSALPFRAHHWGGPGRRTGGVWGPHI